VPSHDLCDVPQAPEKHVHKKLLRITALQQPTRISNRISHCRFRRETHREELSQLIEPLFSNSHHSRWSLNVGQSSSVTVEQGKMEDYATDELDSSMVSQKLENSR